jgi:hypothetical protein
VLLYVRDTGATNPVQFTEVAFSSFDGTTWSTPAAIAADPRGQFSPVTSKCTTCGHFKVHHLRAGFF